MAYTWPDLPNPNDESCPDGTRCDVLFEDHRWEHIHDHVHDLEEPWDDWLADGLATRLRETYQGSNMSEEARSAVRQQVAGEMERAAGQCLNAPLAVVYDVAQDLKPGEKFRPFQPTADLVLPCGAKMCIRRGDNGQFTLRTCYFHTAVCAGPIARRWRWLVRQLILRYAKDNGNNTYSPPDSSWGSRQHEETKEWTVNPRFRSNATWGLDRPLADPWFSIPDPWGPPPTPPPAQRLGRRPDNH